MADYKERLDRAWKKVHGDWIEGTIELATVLWEAKQAHKHTGAFGDWLTKQGFGSDVISHQSRSALIQMGNPQWIEQTKKRLKTTHRHCWENIWSDELKPDLISQGQVTVVRNLRRPKTVEAVAGEENNIAHLPLPHKPQMPTEHEMAVEAAKESGITGTMTIHPPPVIGRMPDDTGEKISQHLREIYRHCHEIYQLCLYQEQMTDLYKQQLAPEFRSIENWGRRLIRVTFGLNKKMAKADAPLCHINVPLRKEGA